MDRSLFGMARRPFRSAVDTASYFPAATHESASASLSAAFERRDHTILLDGQPGTGKSLVARRWLEQLSPDVPRIVLPNAHATRPADLLQAILFDLNENYAGLTEQELRLAVTAQLLSAAAAGQPLVALIDEAQNLSYPALEELRLLGNIEIGGAPALFAILVALPALRETLSRPAFDAIAQRIESRARIETLSAEDSADYIRHQVRAAGGEPSRIIDDEAAAILASACGGIPRVLNAAAGLALELAAGGGSEQLDAEAALEALQQLGRPLPGADEPAAPVVLPHPAVEEKTEPKHASRRQAKPKTARKRSA